MLLPHVMAYNEASAGDAYLAMASACGLSAASRRTAVRSLTAAITRLRLSLHMPADLSAAGISRETASANKEAIVHAALQDSCCLTNPAPVTADGLRKIYEAVSG